MSGLTEWYLNPADYNNSRFNISPDLTDSSQDSNLQLTPEEYSFNLSGVNTFLGNTALNTTGESGCNFNLMYNSEDPSDVNNIKLFYQWRRETLGASALNGEPYLLITEQPKAKYKLRYESEITTTHGKLLGRSSEERRKKFYPTVKLMNFNGIAYIGLTLYTIPSKTNGRRYIHYQRLIKKMDKECQDEPHYVAVGPDNNYTAAFDDMGIIHLPKKDIAPELTKKKLNRRIAFCGENIKMNEKLKTEIKSEAEMEVKYIDPNVMCLCFEAFTVNQKTGCLESLCEPVFSEPIKNTKSVQTNDLHICRMDKNTSSVVGNEEIFMLVEKVAKRNIAIKFYELDDCDNEVWCDYGKFSEKDVHHQYAITFRTPPYRNLNIERDVTVLVALYRRTDGECSEPLQFRYRPKNISCSCHTDVMNNGNYGALTVIPNEKESRNEEFNNIIVPYSNLSAYHTGNFPGNLQIPAAASSDINTPSTSSSSQSSHLQMEAETSDIFNFPESDLDLQAINEILNGDKENNDLNISLPLCSDLDIVSMDTMQFSYNFGDTQTDGGVPQDRHQHSRKTFEYNQVKQDAVSEGENETTASLSQTVTIGNKCQCQVILKENRGEELDDGDASLSSSGVDSDSSAGESESSDDESESSDTESESSDDSSDEDQETTLKTINADIADDTSSHLEKSLKELQICIDFETCIQNKFKISHFLVKESLNEEKVISDQVNKEKGHETVLSESAIDITTKPEIILDLKFNPEITDKNFLESGDGEIVSTKENLAISKSSSSCKDGLVLTDETKERLIKTLPCVRDRSICVRSLQWIPLNY